LKFQHDKVGVLSVTYYYIAPARSTYNILKKIIQKKDIFNKNQSKSNQTQLMFLRSPKHFKSGKQIIYFFSKQHKFIKYFKCSGTHLLYSYSINIFNLLKNYGPKFLTREVFLSKLKICISVPIKF